MTWLRAGVASAFTVMIMLILGGVIVLSYSSGEGSVDSMPVDAEDVPPLGQPVEFRESSRTEAVVASAPDTSGEKGTGSPPVASEPGDRKWGGQRRDGQVVDTGPFIDADDDTGDYSFSSISDVGEFLDPEAD